VLFSPSQRGVWPAWAAATRGPGPRPAHPAVAGHRAHPAPATQLPSTHSRQDWRCRITAPPHNHGLKKIMSLLHEKNKEDTSRQMVCVHEGPLRKLHHSLGSCVRRPLQEAKLWNGQVFSSSSLTPRALEQAPSLSSSRVVHATCCAILVVRVLICGAHCSFGLYAQPAFNPGLKSLTPAKSLQPWVTRLCKNRNRSDVRAGRTLGKQHCEF